MFDIQRLKYNRNRFKEQIKCSDFYNFILDDLIDRIFITDRFYSKILIVSTNADILVSKLKQHAIITKQLNYAEITTCREDLSDIVTYSKNLSDLRKNIIGANTNKVNVNYSYDPNVLINKDISIFPNTLGNATINVPLANLANQSTNIPTKNFLSLVQNYFDLIILPLGIYWANDIRQILSTLYKFMTQDGVIICNLPGGKSLTNLRTTLIRLEDESNQTHYQHIMPMIKPEDVTNLLNQTGFAEQIVDFEEIQLQYKNPISLMRAIKNLGESNIMDKKTPYFINKHIYQQLINLNTQEFNDKLYLITFIATKGRKSLKVLT